MSGHLCLKWNNHSTAFIKSISSIQIKERYCDATIACQGKYFPVHRVVLSTCSDYFDEMFERMQCQHPYIVFKDIEPREMELLLNYMYQGEVNVIQENLPSLIKAAEALKVKGLAVPDDLPSNSKESSGKKRSSASSDYPTPKRRTEERRRRRDSSDVGSHHESDSRGISSSIDRSTKISLEHNIEDSEAKLIKEEPIDAGEYNDDHMSSEFGGATFSGNQSSSTLPVQKDSGEKSESVFVNFPLSDDAESYIKTEDPGPADDAFNDEQASSWGDFASSDLMPEMPETSSQDDIHESINNGTESGLHKISYQKGLFKAFKCCECSYESGTRSSIQRHFLSVHTDERPFSCKVCEKSFARKSQLISHMKVHTGEKPFECPQCSLLFNQRGNLNRHIRSLHQ